MHMIPDPTSTRPGDPDAEFLMYCLEHGVPLTSPTTELAPFSVRNYPTAFSHLVSQVVTAHLALGQVFPRPACRAPSQFVHALGLSTKWTPQ